MSWQGSQQIDADASVRRMARARGDHDPVDLAFTDEVENLRHCDSVIAHNFNVGPTNSAVVREVESERVEVVDDQH